MKKRLTIMAIIGIMVIIAACDGPGVCELPHFINKHPRNAKDFSLDTLTMADLAEKYMTLIDGDTIAVRGHISYCDSNSFNIFNAHAYLYDRENFSVNYSSPHTLLFERGYLFLNTIGGMCGLSSEILIAVRGVIHFGHYGPGVDGNNHPGFCEEEAILDVLSFSIMEESDL